MGIKNFPKALYKGDSVSIVYSQKNKETGENYEFQPGDIVQLGMKRTLDDEEYQIFKEITVTAPGDKLNIYITPEESDAITITEEAAILEVRCIYNGGQSRATTYQDKIRLEGVVIDE